MVVFKSGYYIDEFNLQLEAIVGKDVLRRFFDTQLYFSVTGIPEYFSNEDINPLLKVVWNIITRGEPTRSSIIVTDGILKMHIPEHYFGVSNLKKEVEFKLEENYFTDISKDLLIELLSNFHLISEEQLATEFGLKYLKIHRILKDLTAVAQIQRTVLLLLITNYPDQFIKSATFFSYA